MLLSASILFNALKHHRSSIVQLIRECEPGTLAATICMLGNSQMDIYYGTLQIPALSEEVMYQLEVLQVTGAEAYSQWLQETDGYREIALSDHSRWILLWGTEPGKYIHIHPARYSPYTMRVKATTLKTAIACLVFFPGNTLPGLDALNEVRKTVLQLSPVKGIEHCHHLWKVMAMLQNATE